MKSKVRAGQVWATPGGAQFTLARQISRADEEGDEEWCDTRGLCWAVPWDKTLVRDVEDAPPTPALDSHAADLARTLSIAHVGLADSKRAEAMTAANAEYAARCADDRHREAIKAKMAPGYEARVGSVMGWDKRGRR